MLDRKGATLGTVAPPEARVMTANFNEKRIWAILTDKDGVEHLVRYQIAGK